MEFHQDIKNANFAIETVIDLTPEACDKQHIDALQNVVYRNQSVRMLGYAINGSIVCKTFGPEINLIDYQSHKVKNELYFASVIDKEEANSEIFLLRQLNGKQYFASINPFVIGSTDKEKCPNCLSYKLVIDGYPKLIFEKTLIKKPFIRQEFSVVEEEIKVNLILSVSKEYLDEFSDKSFVYSLLISFAISIVLTLIFYYLVTKRHSLSAEVNEALLNQEYTPYYQSIVDSETKSVVGAEVLLRWCKADGEIIPPNQFIPFAEDSGLIIPITEQLLEKVFEDIVALSWQQGDKFLSINIVPEHLVNDVFFNKVQKLCLDYNVSPSVISLEITERKKIENLKQAREILARFYDLGVSLKLDDAGTGYGGFSYVQELDITTLKIDKMFIDTIDSTDVKANVLDAIITFVHESGLDAIAEGVENEKQVEYLKSKGIFKIQGYVYSKPVPINEFLREQE